MNHLNYYNPYVRAELELYHHGVLGQKKGVRNGPPYPLGSSQVSSAEKKAGWKKSEWADGEKAYVKKKQRQLNKLDDDTVKYSDEYRKYGKKIEKESSKPKEARDQNKINYLKDKQKLSKKQVERTDETLKRALVQLKKEGYTIKAEGVSKYADRGRHIASNLFLATSVGSMPIAVAAMVAGNPVLAAGLAYGGIGGGMAASAVADYGNHRYHGIKYKVTKS